MEGTPKNIEQKEMIEFPEIAEEILRMKEADQNMRKQDFETGEGWDDEVDASNTEAMRNIIKEIGWPTKSKVGVEASRAAWLLVQHADHNTLFQEECLRLMKEQSLGEVDPRDMAYLEDRILVHTERKQRYGTQFGETRDESGKLIAYGPRPIDDEEHIDERRAEVGLEPMEEYIKEITGRYYPHLLDKDKNS
jgi:hypothetical protein